jgi:hypothetical protein
MFSFVERHLVNLLYFISFKKVPLSAISKIQFLYIIDALVSLIDSFQGTSKKKPGDLDIFSQT